MSRPRVLFLDHSGSLGGAELYLLDVVREPIGTAHVVVLQEGPFAERLREQGISMELIPAPAAMLDVQREANLWSGLASIPGVVATVLAISRRLRAFDLLYANSQKALIVGGLAGFLARKPVLWNLHDMLTADHFSSFNRSLATRWSSWFVDRVIVNSEATKKAYVETGGDPQKTHVVYNGISPQPFEAVSSSEVEQLRDALGLNDVPVVGVFSRVAPWKGQHVLLEALEGLEDVHVLLVGEPLFAADAEYATQLRALVREKRLRERVHFLGFRDDVPRLMRLVDAVVHTSVAPEPFGRVIVEGMLARRPVIATRAGGARELVDEGRTGLLVEPGDATALREAIRRVLDGADTAAMVERAYDDARKRFSVESIRKEVWRHAQEVADTEALFSKNYEE